MAAGEAQEDQVMVGELPVADDILTRQKLEEKDTRIGELERKVSDLEKEVEFWR